MDILPDVLAPELSVVFCGTAPGEVSARAQAYYAGPGNRFWPTLEEVGLTPRRFAPHEFRAVLDCRLGLTDLAKSVFGVDRVLRPQDFDGSALEAKIRRYQPRLLAFTSKRAAQVFLGHPVSYGLLEPVVGVTRLFVLTSPSGAACRYWDIAPWRALAALSGAGPGR